MFFGGIEPIASNVAPSVTLWKNPKEKRWITLLGISCWCLRMFLHPSQIPPISAKTARGRRRGRARDLRLCSAVQTTGVTQGQVYLNLMKISLFPPAEHGFTRSSPIIITRRVLTRCVSPSLSGESIVTVLRIHSIYTAVDLQERATSHVSCLIAEGRARELEATSPPGFL